MELLQILVGGIFLAAIVIILTVISIVAGSFILFFLLFGIVSIVHNIRNRRWVVRKEKSNSPSEGH